MTKIVSPPTRPPRLSVPISPDVLAVFERLAKAGNMSTGKAVAEWLADTVEAAELMASTMERARAAPKIVTAELHAMMLGMAEQTKELADKYSKLGRSTGAAGTERSEGRGDLLRFAGIENPPPCNTGGKLPKGKTSVAGVISGFPLLSAKVQAHADTNGIPPKGKK